MPIFASTIPNRAIQAARAIDMDLDRAKRVAAGRPTQEQLVTERAIEKLRTEWGGVLSAPPKVSLGRASDWLVGLNSNTKAQRQLTLGSLSGIGTLTGVTNNLQTPTHMNLAQSAPERPNTAPSLGSVPISNSFSNKSLLKHQLIMLRLTIRLMQIPISIPILILKLLKGLFLQQMSLQQVL